MEKTRVLRLEQRKAGLGLRLLFVHLVLLNGADSSDSSSLGANLVLETNRKQVPLLSREILFLALDDLIEIVDHVIKSFGLLGNSSHENVFFQLRH